MKWILIIWMFDGSTLAVPTQIGDPFDSQIQCERTLQQWIDLGSGLSPNSGACLRARFD